MTLPFLSSATVMRGEEVVADDVPISVWPTNATFTDVGMSYDHQAEAPLDYAEVLRTPNARIYIDDQRFTVVNIERNEFIPHVALALREMNPVL